VFAYFRKDSTMPNPQERTQQRDELVARLLKRLDQGRMKLKVDATKEMGADVTLLLPLSAQQAKDLFQNRSVDLLGMIADMII